MSETLTELHIPDPRHNIDNVVEETREESQERPISARDEMMKLIHQRREEAINRELRHGEDMADEAREASGLERQPREVDEPEVIAETEDAAPSPPLVEAKPEPEPSSPLRTVNIDGQTFTVTEEQYRQLAEVGIRTNVAMSRQNQQAQPQPQQDPQKASEPKPTPRAVLSKEDAEQVAERLLYGGKDQVAQTVQALAEHIAAQTRQETVDTEQITTEAARRATQQALEQSQLQYDLQVISGEYPTIWADRALGELAALQLSHVRRDDQAMGRQRSNLDAYREACNLTLDALKQPRPGATIPPPATQATPPAREAVTVQTTDRTHVLERKRVAPSQPIAVDRRASTSQTPRTKTGSEIVEAMRKSRGQMAMS